MNNDLISRSALKKACSEMVRGSNNSDFIPCPTWNNAMELIDNAPTVVAENATSDRPQGEWVYINKEDKKKGYGGYCSECKCDMPIFNEDWKLVYCETNFCPNCGADMRGEKE